MLMFTASGHYLTPELMADMLPPWVPFRPFLVFVTGLLELAIAAALLWPGTRRLAGWIAIAVLILFFPANIYAALNHVPMGGHAWGPSYLLIRAPLQAIVVLWAYWFTARPIPTLASLKAAAMEFSARRLFQGTRARTHPNR
jgi:uncharacterized membrane protein